MSHPAGTRLPGSSNFRLLGRAALATGTGDVLGRLAGLVTMLLAARALAPAEFGTFVGLSAVAMFAAGVWDFGFSTLVTREVAAGRTSIGSAVRAALRARLQTLVLWLIAFAAGGLILGTVGTFSIGALAGFAAASCLAAASLIPLAVLRAGLRFHAASVAQAGGRWLTAGLAAAALWWFGAEHGLAMLAVAMATGEAATLFLATLFVWRGRLSGRSLHTRNTPLRLRAAIPFAANSLMGMAYNRLDVVLVALLTTASDFGKYAPATRVQDLLYMIPSTMGVVLLPIVSQILSRHGEVEEVGALTARVIAVGLTITIPLAITLFLLTPRLVVLVLGAEYAGAATPTRILLWSMPLAAVGAPILAVLIARGHAGDTTVAFAAAFVIAAGLHLSLDWWLGATGAAVASVSRDAVNVLVSLAFFSVRRASLRRSVTAVVALRSTIFPMHD